jgi:hypothetical protein
VSRITPAGGIRQREPRVRDKVHLGKVAKLPCIACLVRGVRTWPVHVAHIRCGFPDEEGWRPVGAGEKPSDFRTLPLCPACHLYGRGAQHGMSERLFWERLGIHPPALCAALVAAFACGEPGDKVLLRFASLARSYCRP